MTCGRVTANLVARDGVCLQGSCVTNTPRVLVVDGLAETETVLRAVFEPQGARVERRRGSTVFSEDSPPEVVVVDLDDQSPEAASATVWPHVPRVFLGSAPVHRLENQERFLEKPFHYPELVRLVQSLLDTPTERRRVA